MFVIVSGSTGVGKNTIINSLIAQKPDEYFYAPSFTTRAMRIEDNECQGKPYYFVTQSEFDERMERGDIFEACRIHGNMYGTDRRAIEKAISGGAVLIKDVDVDGTMKIIERYPQVVTIYIKPRSREQLTERLVKRGEKQIELRLKRYDYEEALSHNYKYTVINDDLSAAIAQVERIIESERCGSGGAV